MRFTRFAFALLGAALVAAPAPAAAIEWPQVRLNGFLQPSFEYVRQDPLAGKDILGFSETRARVYALGTWSFGKVHFDFRFELEALPQPSLFDGWVALRAELPSDGLFRLTVGQHKAPFSRQILVWDPNLQMIGKAWSTELAPAHQLGLSFQLALPKINWLQFSGGVFNGDGRNVIDNVDTKFMYVGRLQIRPWGALLPVEESAHLDKEISIAVDASWNKRDLGDSDESATLLGADAFFRYKGFSAYGEFIYGSTTYASHDPLKMATQKNFKSLGYSGQAGYLLPLPGYLYRRFEITGRFQGIVRNDTVPLAQLGDPNQAHYDVSVGLNYYQFSHSLKAMVNYHHYILPEEPARMGKAAANDAVFVLLNYKLE